MKKLLIAILVVNLLCLGLATGLLYLAATYPFHPGGALYGVQDRAEQLRLRFTPGQLQQAEWTLRLAERRLSDLAQTDPDRLYVSMMAFGSALDQSVAYTAKLDEEAALQEQLSRLLRQAEVVVAALEQSDAAEEHAGVLGALQRSLAALQTHPPTVVEGERIQTVANALAEAVPIPFLAADVDHSAYPLTGAHAEIECEACHSEGTYAETPKDCDACHETLVT
ncbi:MAG: hypothetical protein JXC32_18370, partial [Anaerolineae bacterium]|nr:hypothetical protein [Anaerolineae bacterium]